nr:unnamed protein product [Callosobruchus chinensis]
MPQNDDRRKKNSWKSYISSIDSETPPSEVWKKIRAIKGKKFPMRTPVLEVNGSLIYNEQEIAEEYAKYFEMDIENVLQPAVNRLSEKASNLGLKFSPSKTKCLHFCRLRSPHNEPKLKLDNQEIEIKETAKFLGLTWDKKLNWHEHIKNITKKCNKARKSVLFEGNLQDYIRRPTVTRPLRVRVHAILNTRQVSLCSRVLPIVREIPPWQFPPHEGTPCDSPVICPNCQGNHPAQSKQCIKYKEEFAIQQLKVVEKISYFEAKNRVAVQTPTPNVTYSTATRSTTLIDQILPAFKTIIHETKN